MGSQAMDRPILSGEQWIREIAAYIIDSSGNPVGFHDVPKTTAVEIRDPEFLKFFNYNSAFDPSDPKVVKIGSLQEFVQADHVSSISLEMIVNDC